MSGETIGWICWSILAIPGAIIIWCAIKESIIDWRWRRAFRRGEIKPQPFQERIKVQYLAAPRIN